MAIFVACTKRIWGRFSPLQTETANESNDKPIASKMIVIISIRPELSDKTIKNVVKRKLHFAQLQHTDGNESKINHGLLRLTQIINRCESEKSVVSRCGELANLYLENSFGMERKNC